MVRWLVIMLGVELAGCAIGAPEPVHSSGGKLGPSLVEAPALDVSRLARTNDCTSCHADVASHWAHSAHAYASFDNPWYRVSVDELRRSRGNETSRFCAGCHDPLLLLSGGIDEEVSPEDDLAYAGITCLVCHSVESTRADGNASFTLTGEPVLIPDPAKPEEIAAHRARLTMEPLRSAALCGSCHRSFSGPAIGNENHLAGIDDLGDWASSAFAGAVPEHLVTVEERNCQGCHMATEAASDQEMAGAHDGLIRSHRWAASHTALFSQLPAEHIVEARDALEGAVTVDVGPVRVGARTYVLPEETRLRGGDRVVFDVVLQNERVGHRFPGGVRDLHDAWLEVELLDAKGRTLGASRPRGAEREDVFVLRATMLDAAGDPENFHRVDRFRAPAFDRTLGAHDARAVRYSTTLPRELDLPLRIEARLRHRKHSLAFQAFACEASRSPRGKDFAVGAERRGKIALDPCLDQPVTTVGSATVWLGRGAAKRVSKGGATRPAVERLLSQSLALLHGKQEHVDLAKPSIERAHELARTIGSADLQARVFVLRARLAATQGRPDQAVALAARAEALIGPNPVLDRLRGDAYARVWRWPAAVEAYGRVAEASPADPRAWRDLARAHGSASDDENALRAANAGLRLAPLDEGLLRSRALALEGLGHADAARAKQTWLAHRKPDEQPRLLLTCEQSHERCRRDRQPIPHYTLTPPIKIVHANVNPG